MKTNAAPTLRPELTLRPDPTRSDATSVDRLPTNSTAVSRGFVDGHPDSKGRTAGSTSSAPRQAILGRHANGERLQQIHYGGNRNLPSTLSGIAHAGHTFEAFDGEESLGKFPIVSATDGGTQVAVDALCMPGGSPWSFKKGAKSSKSSPTGYKLASTGQPCDSSGKVAQTATKSSSRAQGSSSTQPAGYNPYEDRIPSGSKIDSMALEHFQQPPSGRLATGYADVIRSTMAPELEQIHGALKAAVYVNESATPVSAQAALNHVCSGLDRTNPDQARLGDLLASIESRRSQGESVSLPAYYHCTKDEGFWDIAQSSNPRIKAQQPRSGTGGAGAWLSTKPETSAFGNYIFALNRNMDYLHSTRSPERAGSVKASSSRGRFSHRHPGACRPVG